ncbi:MAG: pirin family protein [Culicoidibacterales bacterium]
MLTKYPFQELGHSNHGWLDSHFHFSFADYYNPKRMHFGVLRVINDDLIAAKTGFDLHGHRDMEILSYVISGELTHGDSMGHNETLHAGEAQYMSAGSGVEHSEHNFGTTTGRFLQIWVLPNKQGVTPQYGDLRIPFDVRVDQWFHLVSPNPAAAPITMHQDVNMHVLYLHAGNTATYEVATERQAYVIQIEGNALINDTVSLSHGDGLEVIETNLTYTAQTDCHVFVIEMAKH